MAATEFSGSADASLALDAPSTYSSDALAAASSPAAGLSALWPIGLCVIVFGSFAGAAGDILIRRSFLRMQACPSIRHVIRDRGWVWGMILTAAMDPLSTFVALLFAPATLVAPFAGMHIFWGCLLAVAWLKERMFVLDVAGAALIIAGITLIVIFSGKEQVIGTVAAFGHYLQFPGAITYICVFVVLATLSCVFSSDHVLARVLPPARHPRLSALVQRFAVSCASGIVGGATNIGAKALVVVLTEFLAAPKAALASWSTYVIAFLAAAFGLFQLYYLNAALHRFEASYVVPMINSVLIVSGSVGGILVLQEHPDNWTAFFGGLALVVAGVFVLSSRQAAGSLPGAAPRAAVAAGELVRLASFISFGDGNPGREAFGGAKPGGEGDSTQEESPEGAEKDASLAAAAASDAKERGIDSGQRSSTLDTEAADMCDEIDSKFGGVRGGETPPLSVCGERKQVDGRGPRGKALPAAPSSADIEAAASERGGVEEDEEKGFSPREGKRLDSEETPVAAALCREQPLVRVAVAASSSEDECAEEGRRESAARDACGLREGEKLTDNRRYIIFPRACLRALPRSRLAAVGQNGSEAEEVVTQAAEAPRHSSERKSRPEKFCRVRAPASPLMRPRRSHFRHTLSTIRGGAQALLEREKAMCAARHIGCFGGDAGGVPHSLLRRGGRGALTGEEPSP
ncbi:hypothetical protein BESB_021150 [Besnoitia besnoiti]|uniref:Magnesium transporter NIPA n=1 Tax=Besnoitia besnoiti TaxID=94643 RepID=A0A2A9M4M9_BESBE|nr:hypothetical protein BESB_021150 [Besnoitia besnoiti]PFH32174.1 hypothetical protein BESB_021150 [Besnoitia besnoiti]